MRKDQSSGERELAELVASRCDLTSSLTELMTFLVDGMKKTPEEAAEIVRDVRPHQRESDNLEMVGWSDLARMIEGDSEAGHALYRQIKDAARRELQLGIRVGKSLEPRVSARPWHRAQFLAVLDMLGNALQPRDGVEALLVQQMAATYHQQLFWQERAFQRSEEESWQAERDRRRVWDQLTPRERERTSRSEGWLPERLADAESIELAATLADRHQRAFVRLLKSFRDNRRMFSSLIVAGGQVNIGEQQINVADSVNAAHPPGQERAAPKRRTTPTRVNKRAKTA